MRSDSVDLVVARKALQGIKDRHGWCKQRCRQCEYARTVLAELSSPDDKSPLLSKSFDAQNLKELLRHVETRRRRLEDALRELIYEITHLCAMQPDGSHKPIISARALEAARAALREDTPPPPWFNPLMERFQKMGDTA